MFAARSLHTRSRRGSSLFALLRRALAARRERGALARLDERMLIDIGLTRDQARAETARPMWDVPPHWLR